MNHELTHIDLFSGIGGFAIAAERAGVRTLCFSEVNPYASAVLRRHWPGVPNLGDIRSADFSPYAGATLLTGGFPCQPFSVAGKRRGSEDDRHLWPAMLEVVKQTRPTWIIGENVAGIIEMELERCCADLENEGYQVQPLIIPACAVDAKHRRDRVWIVANCIGKRLEKLSQQSTREELEAAERGEETVSDSMLQGSFSASLSGVYRIEEGAGTRHEQSQRLLRWPTEPDVGRVVNGLPNRVDRIKCIGNSIVPHVAFEIIQAIATIEATS
jgi:DNA (cytosine-5)-methyltransferase 1